MALTSGVQAPGATPVADQYALLATAFTNAGWTNLSDMSAATAGTTDVVKVWASPDDVVVGTEHTGCLVYIEVDETNGRLRFRVSEMYDSSPAGSPASRVKWAVPGVHQQKTPTASYHLNDSYAALFQAAGSTQITGWVDMNCAVGGFNYWFGVNSDRFIYFSNSGGVYRHVYGGYVEYLGSAGGDGMVFLGAYLTSATATNASWAHAASNSSRQATVSISREPLSTASTAGAFTANPGSAVPALSPGATGGGWGRPGNAHQWFNKFLIWPCYLHGSYSTSAATPALAYDTNQQRLLLGSLPEFYLWLCTSLSDNQLPLGDEVVANGVTYTVAGEVVTTSAASQFACSAYLLVDGSQF